MLNIILDYIFKEKYKFILILITGLLSALSEFLVIYITYLLVSLQTFESNFITIFGMETVITENVFILGLFIVLSNGLLSIYFYNLSLNFSYFAEPYLIKRVIEHFYKLSMPQRLNIGTQNIKVSINKRFELIVANIFFPLTMIMKVLFQLIAVTVSIIYIGGHLFVLLIFCIFLAYYFIIIYQKAKLKVHSLNLDKSMSEILYVSDDLTDCENFIEASKNHNIIGNEIIKSAEKKSEALVRFRFIAILPRYILEILILLMAFGYLFFIYISSSLTLTLILPTLASMAIGGLKFVTALQVGYQNYTNYLSTIAQIKELDYIFDFTPVNKQTEIRKFDLVTLNGEVEIKLGVSSKSILVDQVSLKKGMMYLVKGDSGAGKSTFLKIFTETNKFKGSIHFDGVQKEIANLSQLVELVGAKERLNRLDLFEAMGSDVSFLNQLIARWKLDSVIRKLKTGNNNRESYQKLSAGQLQRLILLRSIILDKPILLLDEATNALDTEMEKIVLKDIKQYAENKVVLVVSHREKNIDIFDGKILVKNWRIVNNT